ncbi:MAG TPA: thioredoxin family protein [Pedobacter sp.]|nr:thioredoxin family protein [Pedobacter sp.]
MGNCANNFIFFTPKGEKRTVYALDAIYTILLFYNPECEACKEFKEMLAASSIISANVKTGVLKVLAIYIDTDLSIWKKHLPEMPKTWIQGRDNNEYLYKNNIYDLHAIPTIYLLDKNKKVILKDVLSITAIENAILHKSNK